MQDRTRTRETVELAVFGHWLRTGERFDIDELVEVVERKFNPYHAADGKFTSPPGVTVSYGNSGSRRSGVTRLSSGSIRNSGGIKPLVAAGDSIDRENEIVVTATLESRFDAVFDKPKPAVPKQPKDPRPPITRDIRIVRGRRVLRNPIVDYGKINADLKTKIDFPRIVKSEGGVYLDSYVPWTESSAPNNNSGVTIAGGLDLGGKNAAFFEGVPRPIVDKLSGAFGERKAIARDWNRVNPIRLTPEEGDIIQTFLVKVYAEDAIRYYNNNKIRPVASFMHLSSAQQTVFYDRYFNAGPNGVGSAFFGHALRGDWISAARSLRSSAAANPTWAERMRESADLIDPPVPRR